MPIDLEVDDTAGLIRFRIDGDVTTAEMLRALRDARLRAERGRRYVVLSDHRAIGQPIAPDQLRTVIAEISHPEAPWRGSDVAVVVGQQASYGMMRALAVHAERFGIRVGVFWEEAEARRFLELP